MLWVGISPLGQKKVLSLLSIPALNASFWNDKCECRKRGLEIELAPKDLVMLTRGQFADSMFIGFVVAADDKTIEWQQESAR